MAKRIKADNSNQMTMAVALAVLVMLIVGIMYMKSNTDLRGSAAGRPTSLTVPEVAQDRITRALAKLEQDVRAAEQGRAADAATLARQIRDDQEALDALLAAVVQTGTFDTTRANLDYEEILERAQSAITRIKPRAPVNAQEALDAALVAIEEGLSRVQERLDP